MHQEKSAQKLPQTSATQVDFVAGDEQRHKEEKCSKSCLNPCLDGHLRVTGDKETPLKSSNPKACKAQHQPTLLQAAFQTAAATELKAARASSCLGPGSVLWPFHEKTPIHLNLSMPSTAPAPLTARDESSYVPSENQGAEAARDACPSPASPDGPKKAQSSLSSPQEPHQLAAGHGCCRAPWPPGWSISKSRESPEAKQG